MQDPFTSFGAPESMAKREKKFIMECFFLNYRTKVFFDDRVERKYREVAVSSFWTENSGFGSSVSGSEGRYKIAKCRNKKIVTVEIIWIDMDFFYQL